MSSQTYTKAQADTLLAAKETAGAAAAALAGLTKASVGLGSVDNTSDAAKPISTAQATVNAAKADLVGGLVPTSQIPALALTSTFSVASQAAMLALTTTQVQPGDVAVRTDGAGTFILTATDPTQLANWVKLNAPTDVVTTVNGQQGTVVLSAANVGADPAGAAAAITPTTLGLGNVSNTSDAAKPVSTAQATAIANTTLNLPVNVMTTSGTALIGARNSVDASAGPVTIALPTPTVVGQHLILERADTSTTAANVITVTGTIRGAASSVTLAAVGAAFEGALYIAESLTSWAIASSIKPRAVLDMAYVSKTDSASQQVSADGVSTASAWQHFRTNPQRPPSKVVNRFVGAQGWTGTGVSEDLTTVLFGDRTVKQAAATSGTCWPTVPQFTAQDWSTSIIRLWLKLDVPANLGSLAMYVNMGSGNSASFGFQANYSPNEWIAVTLPRAAFTVASGTINWAGVTGFSIRLDANATGPVNMWVGGIELIPDLATTYPSGVMVVEFDDGYIGQRTYGMPVLAQRGIPATFNVISERFIGGTPASGMTAADLRTLQDTYGWQISGHAYSSAAHGSTVNPATLMEADFQRQKHWLHANGLHGGADHYALCPGTGGPVAQGTMMQALQKSFRSIRVNSGFNETASPGDALRLRSVLFSGAGNNVANLKSNIDRSAGAGGAFIFTMHDVIAGSTDGTSNSLAAMAAGNLATVVDYALSKGMVFRTRADFIDGR